MIKFEKSGKFLKPFHGPQQWRWWQLFSVKLYTLGNGEILKGKRLWFYTRWGSWFISIYKVRVRYL